MFIISVLSILGVPEEELDDEAQEVFLVVCQRVRDYEERGKLLSWLRSICVRVAWNRRRRLQRHPEQLMDASSASASQLGVAPTQHDQLIAQEALALGRHLLQGLPSEQRDVFLSYVVEERRMTDIARAANCPLQTAYSRLHSARSRISVAVKAKGAPFANASAT